MNRIPLEILDGILSELHPSDWETAWKLPLDGKADLDACTLVTRWWTVPAQRQLFRDVTYSFRATHRNTELLLKKNEPPPELFRSRILPMLLDFLRHAPRFAGYIRRLRLDLWPQSHRPGVYHRSKKLHLWCGSTSAVDYNVLVELLHSLPVLDSLQLCNLNLTKNSALARSPAGRLRLSHFSVLHYRETWSIGRQQDRIAFDKLLQLFELVKTAKEFESGWWREKDIPVSPGMPLETEGLILAPTDALFRHLVSSHPSAFRSVRRLNSGQYMGPLAHFQEIVSSLGEQLTELRADLGQCLVMATPSLVYLTRFTDIGSPADVVPRGVPQTRFLDISSCRNLDRFTLGLDTTIPPPMGECELSAACETVRSLPQNPAKLREFTVVLDVVARNCLIELPNWLVENADSIHLLEDSVTTLMDRCVPPLAHLGILPRLRTNEKAGDAIVERNPLWLVQRIFPRLAGAGRIHVRDFYPSVWRTLYVCEFFLVVHNRLKHSPSRQRLVTLVDKTTKPSRSVTGGLDRSQVANPPLIVVRTSPPSRL